MDGASALTYAVRLRVVLKHLGALSCASAALTLVPLVFAFLCGEIGIGVRIGIACAALAVPGFLLARLPAPKGIQRAEALVVTALAFSATALAMALPMKGAGLRFLDALFESISAVTTTGLTATASVEDKPRAFLFLRAWMQWYGGLGFAVLSAMLVLRSRATARKAGGRPEDDLVGSTKAYARIVLKVYVAITALGIALLAALGVPVMAALLHVLASVSTGGFSSHDGSLAGLGGTLVHWAVLLVCLSCALPLLLYHRGAGSRQRRLGLLQGAGSGGWGSSRGARSSSRRS